MLPVQSPRKPNSNGLSDWKDRDSKISSGQPDALKIIKLANQHISTSSVIQKYNIKFQETSGQKWSMTAICPFKSHKNGNERSASFGFNPEEDRFYCFGCRKSGRAVQFIAYYEDRNLLEVAKFLLQEVGIQESEASLIDDSVDKINIELIEFSSYIKSLISLRRGNAEYIKNIDKIIYSFDMHLRCIIENEKFNYETISEMIKKHKEKLI